jgi:hypothetical protein
VIVVQEFGGYAYIERVLYKHRQNGGKFCCKHSYLIVEGSSDAGKRSRTKMNFGCATLHQESACAYCVPSIFCYHPAMHSTARCELLPGISPFSQSAQLALSHFMFSNHSTLHLTCSSLNGPRPPTTNKHQSHLLESWRCALPTFGFLRDHKPAVWKQFSMRCCWKA